ncbi:hypothetical protein GCM10022408_01050 [Hymenobacter fastidiosus]|uniref:Uncharacterized protein n=1 Tax=Hymenobacter fastidiosus TaxID=486264 RepID=A0ABP7R9D3_9BACT
MNERSKAFAASEATSQSRESETQLRQKCLQLLETLVLNVHAFALCFNGSGKKLLSIKLCQAGPACAKRARICPATCSSSPAALAYGTAFHAATPEPATYARTPDKCPWEQLARHIRRQCYCCDLLYRGTPS